MDKNELTQRLYGGDAKNVIQELYEATEAYLKTHPKAYKVRNAKETFFANLASFNRLKQQERQGELTQEQARTQETRILINVKNTIDDLDSAFFDFFSNLSKFETMDLTTLTPIVVGLVKTALKSEAAKLIGNDLKEATSGTAIATWQKFKGLFIKEVDDEAEVVKKLADGSEEADARIVKIVEEALKNVERKKEVEQIVETEVGKPVYENFRKVLMTYGDAKLKAICRDYGFEARKEFGDDMKLYRKIELIFDECEDKEIFGDLHKAIKNTATPVQYNKYVPYFVPSV
jgi:hypothetical protein